MLDLLGHFRGEEHRAVAAEALGLVERDVGVTHQLVGRGTVVRRNGEPDRGGDANRLTLDSEGRAKALRDALDKAGGGLGSSGGAQNHELVAAKAREEVVRPETRAEALGNRLDQFIARFMAQRVVDVLEAVDVDIGRNRALTVAPGDIAVEELVDLLDHVDAVRQAGQRVVLGFVPGLEFALGKRGRGSPEPSEHDPGQKPRGKDAERHQRQDDRQKHTTRLARRPGHVTAQDAVIGDEGFGNHGRTRFRLLLQGEVGKQQRAANLGDEVLVDKANAQRGGWGFP